jgi:hypothetical protein
MSRTEGGWLSRNVFIERGWDRLSRLGGAYAHRMDVLFSKGGLDDETREWLDSRRELQRTDTSHTHSEDEKAGQQWQSIVCNARAEKGARSGTR